MEQKSVVHSLAATSMSEGVGVTVHRTIGTRELSVLDPFLLLDEFVIGADARGAGFPNHPHRGFETVTYMLSGRVEHADNAGHSGVIGPGAAQWMTAGRGIVHSEMPASDGEEIRGLQLWVNLAAEEKMKPPHYQDIEAADIPSVALPGGGTVRVVAGDWNGAAGPVEGIAVAPLYLDLALGAGESVEVPVPADHTAFLYVIEGPLTAGADDTSVPAHTLAVLVEGDGVRISAGGEGVRAILVSAAPLGEPVARHGPFVMNTREEIHQAIEDFEQGRF